MSQEVKVLNVRETLRLGDDLARKGENEEACRLYLLVADEFLKQGFFLKEVALLRQVLKLKTGGPAKAKVQNRLVKLYESLGLLEDSKALAAIDMSK